uniref:Methyltransferase FkbM domain-containing protein n=1 Tax=viral metagenome TaxID=1070528 RepID=A0A6C0LRU2_9ZZZZ
MLIPYSQIQNILLANNIKLTGVLHVGAHECEELSFYHQIGIKPDQIIWIDAIDRKVLEAQNKGIPNVYNAVVTDKDDEDVCFNVSNNDQSSSVLEFGTHSTEHPWVVYVDKIQKKSITLNSFFERNNIDGNKYDFWNFDIQGAELMALKGASNYLPNAKVLYLEVNEKELYKGCALIGEIDTFLSQYNFKRVITNITVHGWGDAMYIKSTPVVSQNDQFINNMRINMVKHF